MYRFYLNHILLPVAPSSVTYKIGNKNNVINIANDIDYNFLKSSKLTEIYFDAMIPAYKYPFCMYEGDFMPQDYFLDIFKNFKEQKKPIRFYVFRQFPNGEKMYYTKFNSVSLESYNIIESAENGLDIIVSFFFKELKQVYTSVIDVYDDNIFREKFIRESYNSPMPSENIQYTVKKGDTLWAIAKYYYGDGKKYKIIADANSNIISNPNKLYIGQVIIIPMI